MAGWKFTLSAYAPEANFHQTLTCLPYDSLLPPTGITATWAGDSHRGLGEAQRGGDRLAYSYRTIIPLTGYIQILCIIIFSPFPSKVFSQYGHHPLQRSQHCSVDHYWSVQLSVSSERKVTKKEIRRWCSVAKLQTQILFLTVLWTLHYTEVK